MPKKNSTKALDPCAECSPEWVEQQIQAMRKDNGQPMTERALAISAGVSVESLNRYMTGILPNWEGRKTVYWYIKFHQTATITWKIITGSSKPNKAPNQISELL